MASESRFQAEPETPSALPYCTISLAELFRLAIADKSSKTWRRIKMRARLLQMIVVQFVVEFIFLFLWAYSLLVLWGLLARFPLRIIVVLVGAAVWIKWIRWRIKKVVGRWHMPTIRIPLKLVAKLDDRPPGNP